MVGTIILSETLGTMMLTLLGCGVVANHLLVNTKGHRGGNLMVNFGWGFAVFVGVFAAYKTGGHLNPAVTFGLLANGAPEYGPGIAVTAGHTFAYLVGEMLGGILGAVLCWLAYRQHYDKHEDQAEVLGTFSTGPQYRSVPWNLITEIIATFVLVFYLLSAGGYGEKAGITEAWPLMGPLGVALVVVGIGASLGGPTGYAINPARDLGPRIAHFLLPIKGKGGSDWGYSWIPVVGPIIGGVLAGIFATIVNW